MSLNLVVFSKDRAAQLELCLRSLERFVRGWDELAVSVLYTASTDELERGYERARELHPELRWVRERAFRAQTLELLDPARGLTAFLVDDDVLREPVSLDAEPFRVLRERPDVLCVSLRMDPRLDYCYSEDRPTPPPPIAADGTWAWRGLPGDWGYPMSLDGHVFRTSELLPLLERLPFHNPNSLEAALAAGPLPQPYVACFNRARLLNVPANRVQDTCANRSGEVDPVELNARFLAGERIALEPIRRERNRAPHHELDYEWEPQSGWARVGLLLVATDDYLPFAERLIESAQRHFLPGHELRPIVFGERELRARVGFPAATLYRYHVFTEQRERLAGCDYLFYCDADMLFVDDVGAEVLAPLTATLHPGYVGQRGTYEERPASTAYVAPDEGTHYFCGGFNGGETDRFLALADTIRERVDADDADGLVAVWHDESHLNRYLVDTPPAVVLPPSYCYPEVVHEHYLRTWPEQYAPKLVALDKELGQFRLERVEARAPKVSVVVPCFNYAQFLPEAVESVCAQTLADLEVVIVDDGSTDDTRAVAQRLALEHPERPIRLVAQPNSGLPAARNAGIAASSGEYVCCLDADDAMSPTYLEACVRALDARPDVSIAYGDRTNFGAVDAFETHPEYSFELLRRCNFMNVAAVYRRRAWEDVGGFKPMTAYEDWEFWLACGERGHHAVHVPEAVWRYRVREGSMYDLARARDRELKAQIVLHHPALYSRAERSWAEGVLRGDEAALALGGELGRIPTLVDASAADGLRILAIMPAFNEADVIGAAIGDLVANGIDVYVLDNCSTDGTVAEASRRLGRGVVRVERFPDDSGGDERARHEYRWADILRRIEQIAVEQAYDWTIFTNPDEFRESPWPGTTLREGIEAVDALGYTAINFHLLNFQPVDDAFVPGGDPREHLRHYEECGVFDVLQIKAWRSASAAAALTPTGGHAADFAGRTVFPVPFILRHYPLRGETHGRRKVFHERVGRFASEERAQGWHVQYDAYVAGRTEFLRDPAGLERWDGDAVRARLLGRALQDVLLTQRLRGHDGPAPLDAERAAAFVGVPPAQLQAVATAAGELAGAVAANAPLPAFTGGEAGIVGRMLDVLAANAAVRGEPRQAREAREAAAALRPRVAGARAFAALAHADELIAAPDLLAAYVGTFDGEDDATLVIVADGGDEQLALLQRAVGDAGLDDEGGADLLVATAPPDGVRALYTRRPAPDRLATLPRFDDGSVAALRRLALRAA